MGDKNINIQRGKFIKSLRLKQDWTQEDFAKRIGKSVGAVSKFENGEGMTLETARIIGDVFNVSVSAILNVEIVNTNPIDTDITNDIKSVESLKNKVFSVLSDLEQGKNREQNTNILMSLSVLMVEELVTIQNNYDMLKLESLKKSGIFRKIF